MRNGVIITELGEELAYRAELRGSICPTLPNAGNLQSKPANLSVDEQGSYWESFYMQLKGFVEKKGHTCLPDDPKHEALKDWLMRQIISRRLLSESQFQRLDRLGVDWSMYISRDYRWNLMLERLESFHKDHGHCRVPQRWSNDRQLALWVRVQRTRYAQDRMVEDRKRKLDALGFMWQVKDRYTAQWEQFFQQLDAFCQVHNHCQVPSTHFKLVSWMERQRLSRKKGTLSVERQRRLEDIGFRWSCDELKDKEWNKRYRQLCAYSKKHGHCFVPIKFQDNKALGIWVATQRGLEAKGKLSNARKQRLDEIGFVWSGRTWSQLQAVHDARWSAHFERLRDYRNVHGTCHVSVREDPSLQRWTCWQRKLYRQGKLSAERFTKLQEIGFPWSVQQGYWMRMYAALAHFREQCGHTRVPCQWETNPRLAAWVYRLRQNRSALSPQQEELLNRIGFDWSLNRKTIVSWQEMYNRLVAFKQQQGHTRVPVRWAEDPKLGKWVSRMRFEKESLDSSRVALLEAIAFEWTRRIASDKAA